MTLIECQSVSKTFRRHAGQQLFRHHIASWFRSDPTHSFHALKNVSFTMRRGESVAVVGRNGAGKSTLLSLISGLARPDSGRIIVNGQIAPLLQLGSGFHPDLTGAENIYLNAALLGFTERQTKALYDSIVEFAEIGDFIREPIRTYSNGMILRLAFSVAINLDPEILIIDEILAVGDQSFQAKCFDRICRFRASGRSILCVSHAVEILSHFCDSAIWLDHGELVMNGDISAVLDAYLERAAV
jgi:ABC-2 type transport system ATP-binding protein/lipopolysaccharide transport system ATP-binding protein